MNFPIVDTFEPVTLLGGGDSSPEDVQLSRTFAPICVAADSGAHLALEMGIDLAAVIGDMDSISDAAKAQIHPDIFHHIREQDSTDFDKALRNIRSPLVIAVGFTGGQIDHALAALHTLVVRNDRVVVLLGDDDVVFVCPKVFSLSLPAKTRVSLFPMGAVRGRSSGLEWPINDIAFAPGVRSGTSNRATGDLSLELDAPKMLCILPRQFLGQVVAALIQQPQHARWIAHEE